MMPTKRLGSARLSHEARRYVPILAPLLYTGDALISDLSVCSTQVSGVILSGMKNILLVKLIQEERTVLSVGLQIQVCAKAGVAC